MLRRIDCIFKVKQFYNVMSDWMINLTLQAGIALVPLAEHDLPEAGRSMFLLKTSSSEFSRKLSELVRSKEKDYIEALLQFLDRHSENWLHALLPLTTTNNTNEIGSMMSMFCPS